MAISTQSEAVDLGASAQPSLDYGKLVFLIGATGISWGLCIIFGKFAITILGGLIGAQLAH